MVGEEFCCLGCGVAADSVVVGSNSGMGDFSLVKFCSSRKSGSKW